MEEWKTIKDFEQYQVSTEGRVRSFKRKETKVLKPNIDSLGYAHVILYNKKVKKLFKIHRLVCLTFLPNMLNKKNVNHINGIKHDNRLENLEWVTHSENIKHSHKLKKKQNG